MPKKTVKKKTANKPVKKKIVKKSAKKAPEKKPKSSLALFKKGLLSTDPTKPKRRIQHRKGVWEKAPDFVEGCKFCRKIREAEVLFENAHIAVVLGRQHHKGHLVVATKKHIENMFDLPEKAFDSYINDTIKMIKALDKILKPATVNIEYLDNWDFHVHWNVYPRFKTDPDYGNPPVLPPRGAKFKEYKMTDKEMKAFKREIKKIKHLW